jgi:Trypsin-co-occurring domain 1
MTGRAKCGGTTEMAIVQLPGDGESAPILIEVGEVENADLQGFYEGVETRGILDKTVTKLTRQLYAEAIELACTCARQTRQQLDALHDAARPDQFEVQLAMNVDAKVGAKIVEVGSAAQVLVRMQWNGDGSA